MAELITIGKLRTVAGLKWEAVSQTRTRALRILARSEKASHFAAMAVEQGSLLGYATLKGNTGHVLSLALLLLPVLRQRGENGLAIFEYGSEGRFWFVAVVRNELAVLSDITGDVGVIRAAVQEFESFNTGNGFCIAPEGFFSDRESEVLSLSAIPGLFSAPQKIIRCWQSRLLPVSTQKKNARLALVAGICLVAWLGWHYWQDMQAQKASEQERQAFLAAKKSKSATDHQTIRPWEKETLPVTFLSRCHQVWKTLPLSIAGWRFTSAECGSDDEHHSVLLARYGRQNDGAVGDFAARLPVFYNTTPVFDIPGSASTAQFVLPVQIPVAGKKNESLLPADKALIELTTYIQHLQATVTIQKQSLNDKSLKDLSYQVYHFTVKTDIPPEHLFSLSFPGLRLTKVAFNLSAARVHYMLQGELYAR